MSGPAWLNCTGQPIDLLVNDGNVLQIVQDVLDLFDSLGHWVGYAPAIDSTGEPIYIEQEPLAA